MSADVIVVRDDTPPEMLEVLLAAECFRAKRCVPKYGGEETPTAYDLHQRRINELGLAEALGMLELAKHTLISARLYDLDDED